MPRGYLEEPKSGAGFVYVCTVQRMAVNLFGRGRAISGPDEDELDEDDEQIPIPIHAFDFVVADECHRGYTSGERSPWRDVLDHFDAVKLGLTATPTKLTETYFTTVLPGYGYEQAVADGYLADYDAVRVRSEARIDGVYVEQGQHVTRVDPDDGTAERDRQEESQTFEPEQIERSVTSPDSIRKILEEVKTYADEHERTHGRFPKTLIFAADDLPHRSHCDRVVQTAREVWGRGEDFARKITGRTDRPLRRIREFRNRDLPAVAVTVDMLTTGVDVPDVEFVVFLRSVRSLVLFHQMLGRGARLGERFPDKAKFLVFDCFDGTLLDYFADASDMRPEPPEKPSRSIRQVVADIWNNRDRDHNVRVLCKRLRRIDKRISGEGREQFERLGVPDGDLGRYAAALPRLLRDDFTATMKPLRSEPLLDLLENYPRVRDTFLVADDHEDAVSSAYMIRDGAGEERRPEDYLAAFGRFVADRRDEIDALAVLLGRPADWGTDALAELREALKAAPERFDEGTLRKAHRIAYGKALVEIVSMVKHAADEQEPLLTAAERTDRAVAAVSAGRDLTDRQATWLGRIREHLVENLSIGRDDFEFIPILADAGGWGRAERDFGGTAADLLKQINRELAA